MQSYKHFETERLKLKPTLEEDATFILKLLNTPKWLKNIGDRKVYNTKDAIKYIRDRNIKQLKKLGYGNYTVVRKSDNKKIGTCGLFEREGLDDIDIGFAFLPEHEGQGYGYESAIKLIELAFNEFELKKITAITTKENITSQKLLIKLGLQYLKVVHLPDDDEPLMFYQLENTKKSYV